MTSTARRHEPEFTFTSLLAGGASAAGRAIVRSPMAVGGTTAFLISFAFVSANALWYQPHSHPRALIETRTQPEIARPTPVPEPQRQIPIAAQPERGGVEREPAAVVTNAIPTPAPEAPAGDPVLRDVQEVLNDLGLYRGTIDGLSGPQTREAIANYRRIVSLPASEQVDEALLAQLGLAGEEQVEAQAPAAMPPVANVPAPTPRPHYVPVKPAAIPVSAPAPAPARVAEAPLVQTAALDRAPETISDAVLEADPAIMRVQAGLKAFGNDAIRIDGVMGDDTKAAIREFQSLFGLPETGTPDPVFITKMREVGLIN